jgi:uncharacterized protein YcfJ
MLNRFYRKIIAAIFAHFAREHAIATRLLIRQIDLQHRQDIQKELRLVGASVGEIQGRIDALEVGLTTVAGVVASSKHPGNHVR